MIIWVGFRSITDLDFSIHQDFDCGNDLIRFVIEKPPKLKKY